MRIIGACFTPEIWPESNEDQTVTVWRGAALWIFTGIMKMMRIEDEQIEIVTDLSPFKEQHPFIQTLIDDKADIMPGSSAGMSWKRHTFVDFSYPQHFVETNIISMKRSGEFISGNFLKNIFDQPTLIAVAACLILQITASSILLKSRKVSNFAGDIFFLFFQGIFDKGNYGKLSSNTTYLQKAYFVIWLLGSFVFLTLFSAELTSKLAVADSPAQIRTMEDLVAHPELCIIVMEGSIFYHILSKQRLFPQIQKRVKTIPQGHFYEVKELQPILDSLFDGSCVLVMARENILNYVFVTDTQDQVKHLFYSDAIDTRYSGFPVNKAFSLKARTDENAFKFLQGLAWTADYRINEVLGYLLEYRYKLNIGQDLTTEYHNISCSGYPTVDQKREIKLKEQITVTGESKRALGIEHVQKVLLIIPAGLFVSFLTFVVEVVISRKNKVK